MELPPLPETEYEQVVEYSGIAVNRVDKFPLFTADQMRTYATAAIAAAVAEEREACAVLCDQMKTAAIQTGHKEISMVPATLAIVIRARSNPTP